MTENHQLALPPSLDLQIAGQAANKEAARYLFADYRARVAINTRRCHDFDLALFVTYLTAAGLPLSGDLATDPEAWRHCTWGIVQGFVAYQLQLGYSIASVNRRLATIRTYAQLAHQAGTLADHEQMRIHAIRSYGLKHGRHVDEQREQTRTGAKKGYVRDLDDAKAAQLKQQPDTPQGRRDAFILCLLIDHGLRVGEIADLKGEHLNLPKRMLTFFRSKVNKVQNHVLSPDTFYAATAYVFGGGPRIGPLWYATKKTGAISPIGHMSARAIEQRIAVLGLRCGIDHLAPHDLRHHWAFAAIEAGTDIKALQDAGGWNSADMPLRYAKSTEIANERVKYKKAE